MFPVALAGKGYLVIVKLESVQAAPVILHRERGGGEPGAECASGCLLGLLQVIERYRRIEMMRRMFHDVVSRPNGHRQDQMDRRASCPLPAKIGAHRTRRHGPGLVWCRYTTRPTDQFRA